MMPTLSVLWKIRKETFSYRKDEIKDAILPLFLVILGIASIITLLFVGLFQIFNPAILAFLQGNDELKLTVLISLVAGVSIFFILTYGAFLMRHFSTSGYSYRSTSGFDYGYVAIALSQLERVEKSLSILGLKASLDEKKEFEVVNKLTGEVSRNVSMVFEDDRWLFEFTSIKTNIELDEFLEGFYFNGINNTQIRSYQNNSFSFVRFYIAWKATVFLIFKMLNRKNDLSGYGSLVLRKAPLRSLSTCVKLNFSSEKAEFLIKHKIPVKDYELAKDLPVVWLSKIYNSNKTTVDN
jgi:hypothetical protein